MKKTGNWKTASRMMKDWNQAKWGRLVALVRRGSSLALFVESV